MVVEQEAIQRHNRVRTHEFRKWGTILILSVFLGNKGRAEQWKVSLCRLDVCGNGWYPPGMLNAQEKQLQEYLEDFLTPHRRERLRMVLKERTRHICCVLEDLYDPGNGSAVVRHCDALGIQELHAIENRNYFRMDANVDMGTGKWLDVHVHALEEGVPRSVKARRRVRAQSIPPGENAVPLPSIPSQPPQVLRALKERGYRIVATSPHGANDATPETLDLASGPVALVFGTEKHGVSTEVSTMADEFLRVPMVGFVDSFNISASAAIVLYVLTRRLRQENLPWQLAAEDAEEIYFRWVQIAVPHADALIRRFQES